MDHRFFRDLLSLQGFPLSVDPPDGPQPPRDGARYARHSGNREASARAFASYGRHAQRAAGQPECPAGACC